MSTGRMRYRVENFRFRGVAQLPKHGLRFHKRSVDGSAKCNALFTGILSDTVFGVVYELPPSEKSILDRAEGLGRGYHEERLRVLLPNGDELDICTYIADPTAIDDGLKPYSWYKEFVLAGADEHQLPPEYVDSHIRAVPTIADPDRTRERKRRAEVKLT
jgi:hypothetical protein